MMVVIIVAKSKPPMGWLENPFHGVMKRCWKTTGYFSRRGGVAGWENHRTKCAFALPCLIAGEFLVLWLLWHGRMFLPSYSHYIRFWSKSALQVWKINLSCSKVPYHSWVPLALLWFYTGGPQTLTNTGVRFHEEMRRSKLTAMRSSFQRNEAQSSAGFVSKL